VRVCRGTACHVIGAERVEDALRRQLHIPQNDDTDSEGCSRSSRSPASAVAPWLP
jgi:NADH:ubiquinone oxidoreductase subunit E